MAYPFGQLKHATFFPALSENIVAVGIRNGFKRPMPISEADLNFLNPASKLWSYPYALYSAGQAAVTENSAKLESWVSQRNRHSTLVIGDSGGFQIQQGSMRFEGEDTLARILAWLEWIADWSVVVDFPTGGIGLGNMEPHSARLEQQGYNLNALVQSNGQSRDYNAALLQTQINNKYFAAHRTPSKTNLLNVFQGRNEPESSIWYESVKHSPFEGICFAGGHRDNFSMILSRMFDLKRDGLLQKPGWAHVLGVARPDVVYGLNAVLNAWRLSNPNIQLSFDAASSFRSVVWGHIYTGYRLDKGSWQFCQHKLAQVAQPGDPRTLNQLCASLHPDQTAQSPIPARTAIGDVVRVADLFAPRGEQLRPDTDGTYAIMHHNTQIICDVLEQVNAIFASGERSTIPPYLLALRTLIEQVFSTDNPRPLISERAADLDVLAR